MNINQCNQYLSELPLFTGSGDFSLNSIAELLHKCNNPHWKLPPTVHVTGTNGKGSVVAYTSHMLLSCGVRNVAFVSPVTPPDFIESLIVDSKVISDEIFCAAVERVKNAATAVADGDRPPPPLYYKELIDMGVLVPDTTNSPPPSQFEVLTAVAFTAVEMLYAKGMIDCFVLEVGLGGRVDSTNIVPPPTVAAITSISVDHAGILGHTEEEIAREKSGIIKSGVQLVVTSKNQNESALIVLKRAASEKKVDLLEVGEAVVDGQHFPVTENLGISQAIVTKMIQAVGRDIPSTPLATPQLMQQIASSFMTQGRLESYPVDGGYMIFDGAHNAAAVESLCATLERLHTDGKVSQLIVILAILSDKDVVSLCRSYSQLAARVPITIYPTAVESKRALSHTDLTEQLIASGIPKGKVFPCHTIAGSVHKARPSLAPKTALVVTGSFYLLRTARQLLLPGDVPKRVQL